MSETHTEATERKPRRKTRCMFKDARGRWWLDYYTPDGKRRRKLVGNSKQDADRALREIRNRVDEGTFVDAHRAPGFSDFCKTFDDQHGQHLRSHSKLNGRIKRLKAYFGDRKLSTITPEMIERYRLERVQTGKARDGKNPISRATVNREVALLRGILEKAVRWGSLARNPARFVEDYEEGESRERYLTRPEILRLMIATKKSHSPLLRPVVALALETGLRKGELFQLRWTDIDFDGQQLLVYRSKTGKPRHVPLSRRARWLLSKMAARNPLSEWVFQSRGHAVTDVKKAWRQALLRARIRDFRFHDLRHTFASHFVMKGGNVYALAKILGHANPKMTLDRYAHLSPEYVQEQRAVMDRAVFALNSGGHQMDSGANFGGRAESAK